MDYLKYLIEDIKINEKYKTLDNLINDDDILELIDNEDWEELKRIIPKELILNFIHVVQEGLGINLTGRDKLFSPIIPEEYFKNIELPDRVAIPNGIKKIGESAFFGCKSLKNVIIPTSVTSIGSFAFSGCSSLTSIIIPDSVTSIEGYAFSDCSSLTSIVIPDSVTSIEKGAFFGCTFLTSVTMGNGVTSIGDNAFFDCYYLKSITIGNGVTSIGEYAFSDCTSLTSIVLPDSVTSIGGSAFTRCKSLKKINYSGTMIEWENNITKHKDWNDRSNVFEVICTDGTIPL